MKPNSSALCTRALALAAVALVLAATPVHAERPADRLLRLVPPDASATLAVEDLAGWAKSFSGSELAAGLAHLPGVEAWRASPQGEKLRYARGFFEQSLGGKFSTIRDDLLGQAVVLSLRVAPGERPDQARGLLLTRFRSRSLLERTIALLNQTEAQQGRQVEESSRTRGQAKYTVRSFAGGAKTAEYYAILEEDVFAWSNSQELIEGVLDRQAGAPGLAGAAKFRAVRERLPENAVASLFVDPRFIELQMAADAKSKPADDGVAAALVARVLAAEQYLGAAVVWRDGFILHTQELFDPALVDDSLKAWAAREGSTARLAGRVPPSALAVVVGHIDFAHVFDLVASAVPEGARPRLENAQSVLRGVLMNKDLRAEVLPCVGPGLALFASPPGSAGRRWAIVAAADLCDQASEKGIAPALENALRTVFALYALDEKHGGGLLKVETREVEGVHVTGFAGGRPPLAFALEGGMLVVGNTPEAVAEFCNSAPTAAAGSRLQRFRSAYFPATESFAFVDLPRLYELATNHRELLVKRIAARHNQPEADARRDLDHALALVHLFRAGFATSAIDPGFTSIHRTVGLIAVEPPSDDRSH